MLKFQKKNFGLKIVKYNSYQFPFRIHEAKELFPYNKLQGKTNLVLRLGNVITCEEGFLFLGEREEGAPDRRLGNVIVATSGTLLVGFCLKIKLQHSNFSPSTQTNSVILAVI